MDGERLERWRRVLALLNRWDQEDAELAKDVRFAMRYAELPTPPRVNFRRVDVGDGDEC